MNRLYSYRQIEGISQAELGTVLGISPQLVSAIESGRRSLTVPLDSLGYGSGRVEVPEMTEPLHRQRSTTKVTSTRRAKELLRLAGETFQELAAISPKPPQCGLERIGAPESDTEIAQAAAEVRGAVLGQEESGAIRNLTAAVERAGICLVPIVGLEGIDGISSWVNDQPVIGLSVTVPGDRFRFSLAHEVAHLVLHTKKGEHSEKEANRFASALLMSDEEFELAMPERPLLRDFVELKANWGISVAALVYRARQFEFIDDKRYRSLQIQMSKWRRSEPGEFKPVYGRLLPHLIEANGGTSTVAKHLHLNEDHLRLVSSWTHLRAV